VISVKLHFNHWHISLAYFGKYLLEWYVTLAVPCFSTKVIFAVIMSNRIGHESGTEKVRDYDCVIWVWTVISGLFCSTVRIQTYLSDTFWHILEIIIIQVSLKPLMLLNHFVWSQCWIGLVCSSVIRYEEYLCTWLASQICWRTMCTLATVCIDCASYKVLTKMKSGWQNVRLTLLHTIQIVVCVCIYVKILCMLPLLEGVNLY